MGGPEMNGPPLVGNAQMGTRNAAQRVQGQALYGPLRVQIRLAVECSRW